MDENKFGKKITKPTRQERKERANTKRAEIIIDLSNHFEQFYEHNLKIATENPLEIALNQTELYTKNLIRENPKEAHMYRSSLILFLKFFNEGLLEYIKQHNQRRIIKP